MKITKAEKDIGLMFIFLGVSLMALFSFRSQEVHGSFINQVATVIIWFGMWGYGYYWCKV